MTYENQTYDQERALYAVHDAKIINCRFSGPADGESFLKECQRIEVSNCFMDLRYPLWHVTDGTVSDSEMTENCRAALWYDKNISIVNCRMSGIKALRECEKVSLKDCTVSSPEFVWKVKNIQIDNVEILDSEYPFFEVQNAKINKLKLKGKYSFQYDENIEITDSVFDTKDAFWHSKNITVRDSVVKGEYLAWYSENIKFINCRIIGTQPFCYCKNLVLENCVMEDCDLSFEKSTVTAEVHSRIDSVKNPLGGFIKADSIGEIILDESVDGKTDCIIETTLINR